LSGRQGISPIKTLKGSDVSREGSDLRNHDEDRHDEREQLPGVESHGVMGRIVAQRP
jgi:hypothetical protein